MSHKHRFTLAALALAALSFASRPANAQLSFVYESFQPSDADPTLGSGASGISASGAVSGTYFDSAGNYHAYMRSNTGAFTTIAYHDTDHPRVDNTDTLTGGINSAGYVIGDAFNYDAKRHSQYVADFIYNSNTGTFLSPHIIVPGTNIEAGITGLQNVNEAGIVGIQYRTDFNSGSNHNASYNIATGTFTYYDDISGYDNYLQAVGPNGELLITLAPLDGAPGGDHGSITRNGVTTRLDFRDADGTIANGTSANAITSTGLISGTYRDSANNPFAFIYDSNSGTYYKIAYPGATETRLFHGNSDNEFAGYYVDATGVYHSLIVTAVPEPSTVALFVGIAVTGTGLLARRRKTRTR